MRNHRNHYKNLLITMNARIIKPAILIGRIRQETVLITIMNESIADCIAILRMRDETTNSQAEIKNVTMALRQAMGEVGFPTSTIDSRISNIDNCAQKNTTAVEFIEAVLDHHAAN